MLCTEEFELSKNHCSDNVVYSRVTDNSGGEAKRVTSWLSLLPGSIVKAESHWSGYQSLGIPTEELGRSFIRGLVEPQGFLWLPLVLLITQVRDYNA